MSHHPRHRPQISHSPRPAMFTVDAVNERGEVIPTPIAGEHPLTLYVDKQEIVTLMTLGGAPEALALGYLRNQRLIDSIEEILIVNVDWEVDACAITTRSGNGIGGLEEKTSRRTVTTGCGQGTMFGDLMEDIERIRLPQDATLTEQTCYALLDQIRLRDTLYKTAGAVHGCALIQNPQYATAPSTSLSPRSASLSPAGRGIEGEGERSEGEAERSEGEGERTEEVAERGGVATPEILMFVEDVGRHNAVDAIAGQMWLEGMSGHDKIFYTTGRLTSEMVIKCAQMEIPFLISRSGLTRMGYEIAQQVGLTMIGRATGKHYLLFTGAERFVR